MAGKGVAGPRKGIRQGSNSGPEHRRGPFDSCCTKVLAVGFDVSKVAYKPQPTGIIDHTTPCNQPDPIAAIEPESS